MPGQMRTRDGQQDNKPPNESHRRDSAAIRKDDGTAAERHRLRFKRVAAAHAPQRVASIAEWLHKSF